MAMICCRECGKDISDSAVMCPHCGAPQKPNLQMVAENKKLVWGVILVIIFGGSILSNVFGVKGVSVMPLIIFWVIAISVIKKKARQNRSSAQPPKHDKPASPEATFMKKIKKPANTYPENDPRFDKNRRDFT